MSGEHPLRIPPKRLPAHPPPDAGLNVHPGTNDDGWVTPPPVSLSDGTAVQLYKDGEGLRAAFDAIRTAQWRICLEIYIFRDDPTGRAFADALCERARAGVMVYLICDALGSMHAWALIDQMRRAGVKVARFHPLLPWRCKYGWRPWNRDHRKLLVIDDDIGWLGGLNIGDEYGGTWIAGDQANLDGLFRDQSIGLRGREAALALRRSFAATWRYVTHGGRVSRTLFIYNLSIGPFAKGHRPGKPRRRGCRSAAEPLLHGDFALLGSVPTLVSPLRPLLNTLLRGAHTSISIVMGYFAPGDELIDNLCQAARRGVRVRLIVPGRSDVPVMRVAARSFYAKLLDHGVQVYERDKAILHAKALVIDDAITLIGSANLDYRSAEFNLEISSFITSPAFARQVNQLMDHDIRFSTQITTKEWRRRPRSDRFVQWLVSRARYLL